ncbi:hypothetical protein Btru_066243 [Bulinus truncatus]|nr:hypothetical protein Btru_066243 [Bulinus truncatus]
MHCSRRDAIGLRAFFWFLVTCFFNEALSSHCDPGPCPKGTYFVTESGKCDPCDERSYMDESDHRCHNCEPCQKPDEQHHEVQVRPCTPESNTVIACQEGYFRTEERHHGESGDCHKCQVCASDQHETQPCEMYSDTLCCPRKGMVPRLNEFKKRICSDPVTSSLSDLTAQMQGISSKENGITGGNTKIYGIWLADGPFPYAYILLIPIPFILVLMSYPYVCKRCRAYKITFSWKTKFLGKTPVTADCSEIPRRGGGLVVALKQKKKKRISGRNKLWT